MCIHKPSTSIKLHLKTILITNNTRSTTTKAICNQLLIGDLQFHFPFQFRVASIAEKGKLLRENRNNLKLYFGLVRHAKDVQGLTIIQKL